MPRRRKWKSFLAFSCAHRPLHDHDAIEWLIAQVRERRPDVVVCLGDAFDAECLSDFIKAKDLPLQHEYDSCAEMLARIRDAAGRRKELVWLMGNHEQRMFRPQYKSLSDALDYRQRVDGAKHWKHYDYRQHPDCVHRIGQVTFYHGFACGGYSVKNESIKLGRPYGLTVSGHTHRPHPVNRIMKGITCPLPYWHVNPGCLIDLNPDYMATRDNSLWGHGIVVGAADPEAIDYRQHWEAELILRRMAWDVDAKAA